MLDLSALTYSSAPLALAGVVASGLLLALLLGLLYRRFDAGLWLTLLVFLAEAAFNGVGSIRVGIRLDLTDIGLALLGAAAAARWLCAADMPRRPYAWMILVAIFFAALASGLAVYGTRAGVQARDQFYAIATASYAMSFSMDERRLGQLFDFVAAAALALSALCIYRWIVYYTPIDALLPAGGAYSPDGPMRVIKSHEALVLAQALLLGAFFPMAARGAQRLRLLTPVLLAAVVALQHRSVWIALVVGALTASVVSRRRGWSRRSQWLAVAGLVCLAAMPFAFSERLSSVAAQVIRSATTAAAGQGSVHARLQDWRNGLLQWSTSGPRTLAFGEGFGRDRTRTVLTQTGEERRIQYGWHNHYLSLLTSCGLVGLLAFLGVVGYALVGLHRLCTRADGAVAAPALLSLLAAQLTYFVPFDAHYVQYLLLGAAISMVATAARKASANQPGPCVDVAIDRAARSWEHSSCPLPAPEGRLRVCALLTCFNRRTKTIACLQALAAQRDTAGVVVDAVLVDDGSSDGTETAVRSQFPWVTVVVADGTLYWCRGMHRAFSVALAAGYDHYLWLNDDALLLPDALARLLACGRAMDQSDGRPSIIIGSTVDAFTGQVTYGGERIASRHRPLAPQLVAPGEAPLPVDSLNGNVVLVSKAAVALVGNLDPAFEHAMGDTDYALRARRLGVALWLAPGVHATCSHNPTAGTFRDESLPLSRRWRLALGRKGLPWRSWLHLTRRHCGVCWPLYFVWPYAKLVGWARWRGTDGARSQLDG